MSYVHFSLVLPVNENLLVELEERKKRLKQEREEEALAGKTSAEKDRKELAKALDKQIRATRCVYKDFKTFLGEFVVKVAPDREEGSRLAHLMQDLYLTFCDDVSYSLHLMLARPVSVFSLSSPGSRYVRPPVPPGLRRQRARRGPPPRPRHHREAPGQGQEGRDQARKLHRVKQKGGD